MQFDSTTSLLNIDGPKSSLNDTDFLSDANEKYGLLGLLGVIRMTDEDLSTLALGSDLTTLGLNLNSPE